MCRLVQMSPSGRHTPSLGGGWDAESLNQVGAEDALLSTAQKVLREEIDKRISPWQWAANNVNASKKFQPEALCVLTTQKCSISCLTFLKSQFSTGISLWACFIMQTTQLCYFIINKKSLHSDAQQISFTEGQNKCYFTSRTKSGLKLDSTSKTNRGIMMMFAQIIQGKAV